MEFEVEGVRYRAQPMGAIREFNVCRRLLGALKTLDTAAMTSGDQMGLMLSVASYLGDAPQADVDYILNNTLPTIQRYTGVGWTPFAAPNGQLMDETVPMMTLVTVLFKALEKPVGDFLSRAMPSPASTRSPAAA